MNATCHFCGGSQSITTSTGAQLSTLISENHWVGNGWIRVDHCGSCTVVQRPRQPRQRRTSVPATDWNMLVLATRKGNR